MKYTTPSRIDCSDSRLHAWFSIQRSVLNRMTCCGLMLLGFFSVRTFAAILIYSEDFGGLATDGLNGTTPDTVSGDFGSAGAAWSSGAAIKADGSYSVTDGPVNDSNGSASALLPFNPTGGTVNSIYTLEVEAVWTEGSWLSIGFRNSDSTVSGVDARPVVGGLGWLLTRVNASANNQEYFQGVSVNNGAGENFVDPTQSQTSSILLVRGACLAFGASRFWRPVR